MLTQNYINALPYFIEGTSKINGVLKNVNGDYVTGDRALSSIAKAWVSGYFQNTLPSYLNGFASAIVLSNGTSEFTGYSLSNPLSTYNNNGELSDYYNKSGATISISTIEGLCKRIATVNFTWKGEATDITEVGMYAGDSLCQYLVAREELKTPISVKNGDTFTVSMTLG